MQVFLLRHGDAADQAPDGSYNDDLRELTTEGRVRLAKAARPYARVIGQGPVRVFHSPLIRARQSAQILVDAGLDVRSLEEREELRPSRRADKLIDLLQGEFLDNCERVLLVGHEPLLGNLLGMLSTGNERLSLPLGKGMLVQISLSEPQVMIGRLETVISQQSAINLDGAT